MKICRGKQVFSWLRQNNNESFWHRATTHNIVEQGNQMWDEDKAIFSEYLLQGPSGPGELKGFKDVIVRVTSLVLIENKLPTSQDRQGKCFFIKKGL